MDAVFVLPLLFGLWVHLRFAWISWMSTTQQALSVLYIRVFLPTLLEKQTFLNYSLAHAVFVGTFAGHAKSVKLAACMIPRWMLYKIYWQ